MSADTPRTPWQTLRDMAGEEVPPYALSHEDGWSLTALVAAINRRGQKACEAAKAEGGAR